MNRMKQLFLVMFFVYIFVGDHPYRPLIGGYVFKRKDVQNVHFFDNFPNRDEFEDLIKNKEKLHDLVNCIQEKVLEQKHFHYLNSQNVLDVCLCYLFHQFDSQHLFKGDPCNQVVSKIYNIDSDIETIDQTTESDLEVTPDFTISYFLVCYDTDNDEIKIEKMNIEDTDDDMDSDELKITGVVVVWNKKATLDIFGLLSNTCKISVKTTKASVVAAAQ